MPLLSVIQTRSLARAVFHGHKGELRQRYREGQEDPLGALGLVVNMLVLWTTRYMDVTLAQMRAQGLEVRDEDVARLSPLGYSHVNLLGRYEFALPDSIARGAFRPLLPQADGRSHDRRDDAGLVRGGRRGEQRAGHDDEAARA